MIFFKNTQDISDESFKKDIELFKEYQEQASKPKSNSFIFAIFFFWMPFTLWAFKTYIFSESAEMNFLYSMYLFVYSWGVGMLIFALVFNSQQKVIDIFISSATERFEKNTKVNATPNFNVTHFFRSFFTPSMLPFLFMFYVYINEDKPILFILCGLFLTIISYYMLSTMKPVISHVANLWEKKKIEIEKNSSN